MNIESISKLVKLANDNKSCLDDSTLNAILNEMIDGFKLNKYVSENLVDGKENDSLGAYIPELKLIYWNRNHFNKMVFYQYENKSSKWLPFYLYYNIQLLQLFFYEIRHACQEKILSEKGNYLSINKVISDCREFELNNSTTYYRYHDLFPIERDADIFGLENVIDNFVGEEYYNLTKKLNTKLFSALLRNYDLNNLNDCPLKSFYMKFNCDMKMYNYVKNNSQEMPLYDKMSFGMCLNDCDMSVLGKSASKILNGEKIKVLLK